MGRNEDFWLILSSNQPFFQDTYNILVNRLIVCLEQSSNPVFTFLTGHLIFNSFIQRILISAPMPRDLSRLRDRVVNVEKGPAVLVLPWAGDN